MATMAAARSCRPTSRCRARRSWWPGSTAGQSAAVRIRPFGGGPEPTTAEIKRMFVRADVRGRGVAQAVLARLEQEARGFGYSRLVLETGDKQFAAIRLYERAGYVRIPCYGEYAGRSFSICYGRDL
jgi:putative acetyltransferase